MLAADPEIDVLVELIGGEGDPARAAVTAALAAGKSVVTANKALLARHGVTLAALAEKNRVALEALEAAVGSAIPIVKDLARGPGRQFARAHLRHPQRHLQLHPDAHGAGEARLCRLLKEAQRLGYAEADPSTSKVMTSAKLAILASLAFGKVEQGAVYVEGISSIAPKTSPGPTSSAIA